MTKGIVLVTGGSGQLGRMFLRHYGGRYALRLTYNAHPFEAPGHEVMRMELTDFGSVARAVQGARPSSTLRPIRGGTARGSPCCPTTSWGPTT